MRHLLILLGLLIILLPKLAYTQEEAMDPGWQWGRLSNVENSFRNVEIRTNFYNEIFTLDNYLDSIFIEDTAFIHRGGSSYWQDFNLALIKRTSKGEFVKALDVYTPQNKDLYYADIELDNESNIYLFGTFEDTLFLSDTILLPDFLTPHDDIYLLKLDKNFNFKWAKKITYIYQDACGGMAISKDNYIYLTTYEMNGGYDTLHYYVDFFNQDSTEVLTGVISLLKIDPDGNIIWRDEIRKSKTGYTDIHNTIIGEDGNIYIAGNSDGNDLYIQGDTLEFPDDPYYANDSFIIKYGPDGVNLDAYFFAFKGMGPVDTWLCIDEHGNYYISGIIYESMIFGSDTIELPDNGIAFIITKMDPGFSPLWTQVAESPVGGLSPIHIKLFNDSLVFALRGRGHFTFMDSAYAYNSNGQVLTGLFDAEGNLQEFQITESSLGTRLNNIYIDNCGNLLIDGSLQGTSYFGNDTLIAGYGFHQFLAKNNRIPLSYLEMPLDTTGCDSIILYAPEGYLYYQWNGELSDQNWFIVNTSGVVNVKAANEYGCWAEGEAAVTIYPAFEFSLGMDKTILITDTLELEAPGGYEHYLWSTGDTVSQLVIPATQLQTGDNLIWLEIDNGPCSFSDTITVKVVDNSSIHEFYNNNILIYPNPASSSFHIITSTALKPESVIIFGCDGRQIMKIHSSDKIIDGSSLDRGMYIIELIFRDVTIKRKLIIL